MSPLEELQCSVAQEMEDCFFGRELGMLLFISPALVQRIGMYLEESEGLRLEEHAGPVP